MLAWRRSLPPAPLTHPSGGAGGGREAVVNLWPRGNNKQQQRGLMGPAGAAVRGFCSQFIWQHAVGKGASVLADWFVVIHSWLLLINSEPLTSRVHHDSLFGCVCHKRRLKYLNLELVSFLQFYFQKQTNMPWWVLAEMYS